MNKTKKVRDGKVFTIYLERDHLEHMKKIAHKMSLTEGRDISTTEAIRMALMEVYPMESQLSLFNKTSPRRIMGI